MACGDKLLKEGFPWDCSYIPPTWAPKEAGRRERAYKWILTQCGSSPTHLHILSTHTYTTGGGGGGSAGMQSRQLRHFQWGEGGSTQQLCHQLAPCPEFPTLPCISWPPVSLRCTLDSLGSLTASDASDEVCPPILTLISVCEHVCKAISLFGALNSDEFRWDGIHKNVVSQP